MNKIDMQYIKTIYNYAEHYFIIDGKVITQYIDEYNKNINTSFLGLMPAWTGKLEYEDENCIIWEMIDSKANNINIPILVCEDDCDLSCTVVIVKIRKSDKFVYWDKIGFLNHKNHNNEKYFKSGILHLESYTDEDWEKYGSNIALAEYGSWEWKKWVSQNWQEERRRRNKNYIYPFIQNENNIDWFKSVNWVFDINQYNNVVEKFRKVYKENH